MPRIEEARRGKVCQGLPGPNGTGPRHGLRNRWAGACICAGQEEARALVGSGPRHREVKKAVRRVILLPATFAAWGRAED